MNMHRILFDKEIEDKVIGGKYTLRQGIYLMLMFIVPSWLFFADSNFSAFAIIIKIVVTLFVLIICSKAAFQKVSGYYWDYYLIKKYKFKRRKKTIIYRKF